MYGLATPTGEVSLYIRHTCQHADNLGRYGWSQHDGRSFGQQEITDSCKDMVLLYSSCWVKRNWGILNRHLSKIKSYSNQTKPANNQKFSNFSYKITSSTST